MSGPAQARAEKDNSSRDIVLKTSQRFLEGVLIGIRESSQIVDARIQ